MKDFQKEATEEMFAELKTHHAVYAASIKRTKEKWLTVMNSEQPELALAAAGQPTYSEEYEIVWKAWLYCGRGRGTKHGGWKSWRALLPVPKPEDVCVAMRKFEQSWRGTEDKLIPHFETWCGKRSWESPPQGSRPPQQAERAGDGGVAELRKAAVRADESWRAEWAIRWPEKAYPGVDEARKAIMLDDERRAG